MALDGPSSSENRLSVPKKLIVEEVQVGGAPSEHAEYWKALEIVESALKYTALTFRKTCNSNNKRDVMQRLKEVIHSMHCTKNYISQVLGYHGKLKKTK